MNGISCIENIMMRRKTVVAKAKVVKKKTVKKIVKKNVVKKKVIKKKVLLKKRAPQKKNKGIQAKNKIQKKVSKVKAVSKIKISKMKKSALKKNLVSKATQILPLRDKIVIRLLDQETVTAGGLIIPGTVLTNEGYSKGVVLSVGLGLKSKKGHLKPLDVKKGDTVLFQKYTATQVEEGLEKLYIVNESNILGIV